MAYKKLNSTGTLIQSTTMKAPQRHMYYIGLDVHKIARNNGHPEKSSGDCQPADATACGSKRSGKNWPSIL